MLIGNIAKMNLIPTKDQWEEWPLTNKLTAIGTFLGLLSLVITIILYSVDKILVKNSNDVIAELHRQHSKLNKIIKINSSSRELAYSIAIISALGEISDMLNAELSSDLKYDGDVYSEKMTSKSEHVFRDRFRVNVKSVLSGFVESDTVISEFKHVVKLTFLKSLGSRNLPQSIEIVLSETDDEHRVDINPKIGSFSPIELLFELNTAGFFIRNIEEIGQGEMELTIANEENEYLHKVSVDIKGI